MFAVVIVNANKISKTWNNIYVSSIFVQQIDSDQWYIDVNNVSIQLDENQQWILRYVVQAGDSLYGIASKFGTTISRVKKINNIQWPIRPNQVLIISEDDGLLYIMKSKMNVKVFAEKYSLNLQDVMTLNGIADESEILYKDQEIFLNISNQKSYEVGLFPKPKPKIVAPKKYKKPVVITRRPSTTYSASVNPWVTKPVSHPSRKILSKWTFNKKVSNGFYAGHCTWYMALTTPQIFTCKNSTCSVQKRPFRWNAKDWYKNAAAVGYSVGQVARPWSIVVYSVTSGRYAYAGHVAKVISVNKKEGTMVVEEMNYLGKYIVTRRVEVLSNRKITGYIYP